MKNFAFAFAFAFAVTLAGFQSAFAQAEFSTQDSAQERVPEVIWLDQELQADLAIEADLSQDPSGSETLKQGLKWESAHVPPPRRPGPPPPRRPYPPPPRRPYPPPRYPPPPPHYSYVCYAESNFGQIYAAYGTNATLTQNEAMRLCSYYNAYCYRRGCYYR